MPRADEVLAQVLARIEAIKREIRSWEDVPERDGPSSVSLSLMYDQIEDDRRLPILRDELDAWTAALAEFRTSTQSTPGIVEAEKRTGVSSVEVKAVIETVDCLTPSLLTHLRRHHDELAVLPWDVFEHLVGEWLKTTVRDWGTFVNYENNSVAGERQKTLAGKKIQQYHLA